jgi:hypothetical protein
MATEVKEEQMLEQELNANDPIIDDIHRTQGAISTSRQFDDIDALSAWLNSFQFDPEESGSSRRDWLHVSAMQWEELKQDVQWGKIPSRWRTYQQEVTAPMSFYVAEQRANGSGKLLVLLRVGREGDRRRSPDQPSILWTYN